MVVVIGIIAILAAIVIIAINPARQFAQARNSQRVSNVNAILNAIGQNIADNKGIFTCSAGTLPAAATVMGTGAGDYNVRPCIVPTYLPEIPFDPSATGASINNTQYTVVQDATTKRVTVTAPEALNETAISATPPAITVTR